MTTTNTSSYEAAKTAIKRDGKSARLPNWPECKHIRAVQDADSDFFASAVSPDTIVQICDQPCDCKVGVWVAEAGEKESNDWIIL